MSKIPHDLQYTQSHEWVRQDEEYMTVVITDHAQTMLGDLVYVELPVVETNLHVDQECELTHQMLSKHLNQILVNDRVRTLKRAYKDNQRFPCPQPQHSETVPPRQPLVNRRSTLHRLRPCLQPFTQNIESQQ